MGENTGIEWCDHTFNPWIGCTKVSPGCDHCYAEALATNRLGVAWGPHAERRRTADSTWRQPLAWNRKAKAEGRRARVFCASLADAFDNQVPALWRIELWGIIQATPHLDWLLLTKRPQNIAKMLPPGWGQGWPNVWLGTTAENQAEAERRIPQLLAVPARLRFLSCEPLLSRLHLDRLMVGDETSLDALRGLEAATVQHLAVRPRPVERLHWVIAGGESGPGARPPHPTWFRSLRDQCSAAGVPFFFKQWGDWRPICEGSGDWYDSLFVSNRVAKPHESQEAVDEHFGHRCRVRQCVVQADGAALSPDTPMAFQAGTGAMLTFQVGKRAAGAMLNGREHREVPHV